MLGRLGAHVAPSRATWRLGIKSKRLLVTKLRCLLLIKVKLRAHLRSELWYLGPGWIHRFGHSGSKGANGSIHCRSTHERVRIECDVIL